MNVNKNLYNAALDTLSYLNTASIGNSNDLVHGKSSQILDRLAKIFENVTEDQTSNLLSNDNFVASLKKLRTEITSIPPEEAVETGETKEKLEGLISRINRALNSEKKVDQIPGTILDIPEDVLAEIGQFLEVKDLLNLTQVCKKLLEARPKIIGQNENFINFLFQHSLRRGDGRHTIPEKLLHDSTQHGCALKSISLDNFALRPKHLPIIIDLFPNLESLNFADQGMAEALYEMSDPFIDLSRLKKLKNLRLEGSADLLAKAFPHISKKLESLEIFIYDRAGTKGKETFKNELLSFLIQAPSLKEVRLRGNNIDDEILQAVAKSSPKLETFTLSMSDCTKSGFQQFFAAANSLKFINLQRQDIDDVVLETLIDPNSQLETLNLEGCNEITKEGFQRALARAKSLKFVDLSSTKIDDRGLQELIESNPQLEFLKLTNCTQITKEGLQQALATTKALKSVNLARTEIGDEGLQALIDSNPNLETLNLYENRQITKEGFRQALATAKALKSVSLDNTEIGDEGLQALIDSNTQLEVLKLDDCQQITKEGFRQALAGAKSLKSVSLGDTEIGDEGLQVLIESNPRLETLYLWRCRQITEEGVSKSVVRARSLKLLASRPTGMLEGKELQNFLAGAKS